MGIQQIIDNPGFGEFALVDDAASDGASSDPGAGNWQLSASGNRLDISHFVNGHDLSEMLSLISVNAQLYLRTSGESRTFRVVGILADVGYHSVTVDPAGTKDSTGFAVTVDEIYSIGFQNPSADGVPGPIGPKGDQGDQGIDGPVGPAGTAADVHYLVATQAIPVNTPITDSNTSGDGIIPYTAGQMKNELQVVVNGIVYSIGATADVRESNPTLGTFTFHQFELSVGSLIQLNPRAR